MTRNIFTLLASVLAWLLLNAPSLAAPFNSYPPAPPPNGSAVSLVWQGGPTVATANNSWTRANLGVAQVRTLESFAVALGVTLGSANDQTVFDAANAAIIAAAGSGGLAVALPMGQTENATHLLLDNNGGYFCPAPGQCRVHDAYAGPYTSVTYLVELNNPYATNPVLAGIYFDGGWTYGAGAYSANPESDPALDKRGGVNLVSAFNGVSDSTYAANSFIASQEPRKYIQDLVIARFPGDCFAEAGAGSNDTHNLRTQRCGGHGANINTYDSNFYGLDLGENGRSGLYCHDNCASNRFVANKSWYGGFRNLSQLDTAGVDCEGCSSNEFIGLQDQDPTGDGVRIDDGNLNRVWMTYQIQGSIPVMQPVICAVRLLGATNNEIDIIASQLDHAGQTYYRANKLICDGRSVRNAGNTSYAYHNPVSIVTEGWPQDFNSFSQTWITGPFDTSNSLTINGVTRVPSQWAPDPATGQTNFGASMRGTVAGMIAWGPKGAYPGSLSFVTVGGTMSFQGETTTGAYATGTLTSSANYNDGETIQVGATVYTMKATLTGAPNEIHIGATEAGSLANIINAINASNAAVAVASVSGTTLTVPQVLSGALHVGDTVTCLDPVSCGSWVTTTITAQTAASGAFTSGNQGTYTLANSEPTIAYTNAINVVSGVIGTDYGYGTTPSFQVTATNNGSHVVTVTAVALGVAGNTIPIATTASHAAWSGADLAGGAADVQSYNNGLTIDQFGNFGSPKLQLQGHFTSDAAYCASPHAVNGGFYTDVSSGRAVVYQASC